MIDFGGAEIPPSVIEMVPESVAREKTIIPLKVHRDALVVCFSEPVDPKLIDQLRFILNHDIEVATAPSHSIEAAINQYYGA